MSGSADSQTHHTQPQATTHHELLTPTYYCVYVYNIYILYISIYRVIKEVGGRRSFGFLGSGRRSERGRVFDGLRPPSNRDAARNTACGASYRSVGSSWRGERDHAMPGATRPPDNHGLSCRPADAGYPVKVWEHCPVGGQTVSSELYVACSDVV